MRLLLLNGSPHKEGNTHTALKILEGHLEEVGISYLRLHVGATAIGCLGCGGCKETGKCVVEDRVNLALSKARECDGYVFASPVHYGGVAGCMKGFLDRFFRAGRGIHIGKCASALVVARRAGGVSAYEELLRYLPLFSMVSVGGDYWNILYGTTPEEILGDVEGIRHLRALATSLAAYGEKTHPKP